MPPTPWGVAVPYSDFTYDDVEARLLVTVGSGELFPGAKPRPVPAWLPDVLARTRGRMPLTNEKARSEAIVSLLLIAVAEALPPPLSVFSGQRLDVDALRGLTGECDFILAKTPPLPKIRAPILTVVEAKNADLVLGLGQCIAQMEGARVFNERAGTARTVYGCVTTGELWQFLRHDGPTVLLDATRYALDPLDRLLGVFHAILA